jgi:hypothetical protein
VTNQPQNGPTERTGAGSEPTGDMPAALGPDAPTEVRPVQETELPAVPVASEAPDETEPPAVPEVPETPAVPPPPPPAIATAMDSQAVTVTPPERGESASPLPPPQPVTPDCSAWRPEDEPSGPAALATDRPEMAIGAAFAGGLVLALILKRLAR